LSSLNRGPRVIDTLATIEEFGEVTAMELAEYLGITRYDACAVLNRMIKRTKAGLKRIYIIRYIHDHEGARKYPRAVYAQGDRPDAKKPKADQNAVKREYYARLRSRTTMNSVFNLGLQWREREL
jgi:DNA-binding MarR family transcriptional regulator